MHLVATSDLDREIVLILERHPELQIKFEDPDLSKLDTATKEALLDDMRFVLGESN